MAKNVICLWYDGTAEDAARFYTQTFPDSAVTAFHHPSTKITQLIRPSLGVAVLKSRRMHP